MPRALFASGPMRQVRDDCARPLPTSLAVLSLGIFAAVGAALAFGAWTIAHFAEVPAFVTGNVLQPQLRRGLLVAMLSTGAATALLGTLVSRPWRAPRFAATWRHAQRVTPLFVLGLLPSLLARQAWTREPLTFLVAVGVVGLLTLGSLRTALGTLPPWVWTDGYLAARRDGARWRRLVPLAAVLAAAAFYAVFFSRFTIGNHYHLHTRVFDLAVEHNLLWQAAHGGALFRTTPFGGPMSHLGWHQTYFSYLLALPFRLWPHPEAMLAFQSTIIGFTALPLYLLARRRLGAGAAAVLSVLFVFYAPSHGANLYDFHYQTCFGFFVLFTLYAIEERRWIASALLVLVTLSIREDAGILLGSAGLYLVARGERPKAGLAIIALSALHFSILKVLVMPRFLEGQQAYANIYSALVPRGRQGFGPVLETIVGNPLFTLGTLLSQRKLVYALSILAPLAFLPLRRPLALLLIVPGILFTLLASHEPMILLSFQYTMVWGGMAFAAAMVGLERALRHGHGSLPGRAELVAWLGALSVSMLLTSHQQGVIFDQRDARGGFQAMHFRHTPQDHRRHADLYALIAQIPPEAGVLGTNWVVSHVSARDKAFWIQTEVPFLDCEYLLFETTRLQELEPARIGALLRSGKFGVVEQRGDFVLARQGHDPAMNAEVVRRLRLP